MDPRYGKETTVKMPDTISRVATAIIVVIVVIIGGIITLTDNSSLSYGDYLTAVGVAVGLLGIGYGIDAHSKP
jgi:hypothetical protein